jgi:hypothetical protein
MCDWYCERYVKNECDDGWPFIQWLSNIIWDGTTCRRCSLIRHGSVYISTIWQQHDATYRGRDNQQVWFILDCAFPQHGLWTPANGYSVLSDLSILARSSFSTESSLIHYFIDCLFEPYGHIVAVTPTLNRTHEPCVTPILILQTTPSLVLHTFFVMYLITSGFLRHDDLDDLLNFKATLSELVR